MRRIQVRLGLIPPCEDVIQARENVLRLIQQGGISRADFDDIINQVVHGINNDNDAQAQQLPQDDSSSSVDASDDDDLEE